jgi:hypothetical protein
MTQNCVLNLDNIVTKSKTLAYFLTFECLFHTYASLASLHWQADVFFFPKKNMHMC